MYSAIGRPSTPPERLLKATVEPSPDHSTFSRNRERLLEHDVAGEFFRAVVDLARSEKLMSDEHFTVDGTLIEAMASLKSFRLKGYDTQDFVEGCRQRNAVPHVAQNQHARRSSAIDARTTRHAGYAISQRIRKRVEEIFGWAKTAAGFRRTRLRGKARTQLAAYFVGAAYNLIRIARLLPLPEGA